MRVLVVVNAGHELGPRQTTTRLVRALARDGHEVWVCGVGDLALWGQGVWARAWRVGAAAALGVDALAAHAISASTERIRLDTFDAWWLRTNPGRDVERPWAHDAALELALLAQRRGVHVCNDPVGLFRASSKLYLASLPPVAVPAAMVGADPGVLKAALSDWSRPFVLKPIKGSRGRDVFYVEGSEDRNLPALLAAACRSGAVMAQEYLPEASRGDVRLLMLDGEALEVGGRLAAIRRIPASGDWRSNLHVGGHAEPAQVTPSQREIARQVGGVLRRDGLWLVGLDFVGELLVEVNAFSTGGLYDAERFEGVDFSAEIAQRFAARVDIRT